MPQDKLQDESDTTDTDHGEPSPRTTLARSQVPEYLKAINNEATSWLDWKSVEPLSHQQARQVLNDKIMSKRIPVTGTRRGDRAHFGPSAA